MAALWPWFVVAGLGALHGLNPASGWMLAAAWGVQSGDRSRALQALLPIAAGHAASIVVVAGAVAVGGNLDRSGIAFAAALLLLGVALKHALPRALALQMRGADTRVHRPRHGAAHAFAALGLGSFISATLHGAGLMLVPALVPLCLAATPGRELTASGSFGFAVAAVAVHMAAMLLVTGAVALGACRVAAPIKAGWSRLQRARQ